MITFRNTQLKITEDVKMLVAARKNSAQRQLLEGLKTPWRLEQPLKRYAHKVLLRVTAFEEEVDSTIKKTEIIYQLLHEMKECPITQENFESRISTIQKIIGDFDLEDLSNLTFWVTNLNQKVEKVLVTRF